MAKLTFFKKHSVLTGEVYKGRSVFLLSYKA